MSADYTISALSVSELIDENALASRLGVSRSTLQSWRYSGRGPRYVKIGRLVRYRNADVAAFLLACARGGPADGTAVTQKSQDS